MVHARAAVGPVAVGQIAQEAQAGTLLHPPGWCGNVDLLSVSAAQVWVVRT
jgi:hypothetical protein